jgi:hypothetical protein
MPGHVATLFALFLACHMTASQQAGWYPDGPLTAWHDRPTRLAGLFCWRYRYVHKNISMIARRRQSLLLMKTKASLKPGGRYSA